MYRSRIFGWLIWCEPRSVCTATKSSPNTMARPRTGQDILACSRCGRRTPATRIRSAYATATIKSFPVGIGFGSRVFVCDNLAFIAEQSVKRRHTANLKRDLPGIIGEMIEPLALHREAQARTFDRYRRALLTDAQADHAVLNMFRQGIANIQRVPEVLKEWEEPPPEEFDERNAWRLFNAATFALTGRVLENANLTPRLHQVIDGVCEWPNRSYTLRPNANEIRF